MRQAKIILLLMVGIVTLMSSCRDEETYAEQLEQERDAINDFISAKNIKVISETEFAANNYTTDVSKNEFVYFGNNGVYMQIVRKGSGEKLGVGETATVLCRYNEYNLLANTDTVQTSNNVLYYQAVVDKMTVTNTSGTFSGYFDANSSVMYTTYGKNGSGTAVPSGWLVPLPYINLGRPASETDEIAKVNLIVPSAQGQSNATTSVYPCYYELTYQRGR